MFLHQPITIEANSAMNQSEFQAITCDFVKGRENRGCKERFVLVLLLIG